MAMERASEMDSELRTSDSGRSSERSEQHRVEQWAGSAVQEVYLNAKGMVPADRACPSSRASLPNVELENRYGYNQGRRGLSSRQDELERGGDGQRHGDGSRGEKTTPPAGDGKTPPANGDGKTPPANGDGKAQPDLEKASAERAKYESAVIKQADAASISQQVKPGEGYFQVLARMYPGMKQEALSHLAIECKKMNGNKALHPGDQFPVMNKEQKLRLVDQVMNDYDAKHKTDALDKYGDFASEKGKLAGAHNAVRKQLTEGIEEKLASMEKPSEPPKTEPPKPPEKEEPPKPAPVPQVEKLAMKDFVQVAKEVAAKIDTNRDGHLSHSELMNANYNPALTAKEAQAVAGMLAAETQLAKQSNDRLGREKEISIADLDKFGESFQSVGEKYGGARNAQSALANDGLFNSIDRDGNGRLSKKELECSAQRPDLNPSEQAALRYVLDNYSATAKIANDDFLGEKGVSRADVHGLKDRVKHTKDGQVVGAINDAIINAYIGQRRAQEQTPVELPPVPQAPPVPGEGAENPCPPKINPSGDNPNPAKK